MPVLVTMAQLQYAYDVSDLVGVVADANLGYGESGKREASSGWYHTLGAAVDFDFNPRTSVPVGIGLGARFYNVPVGDPSLDGVATLLILRVSHTGTSDLDLGIDLESRWLKLLQIDNALRYTSLALDFHYFF